MNRIGENLRRTNEAYGEAMGQLRDGKGNLIGQVDKLRALGVKAKKTLSVQPDAPAEADEGDGEPETEERQAINH